LRPVGCGTVFELLPKAGGGWTEKVLHNFSNDGKDGANPIAGRIEDHSRRARMQFSVMAAAVSIVGGRV